MASTYNQIVRSPSARGLFIEGILATGTTPKPGTCLSLTGNKVGELFEYEPWNGAADGEQDEVIVLIEDALQGKTVDDAYADSAHVFAYIPLPGDELYMLFGNAAGTGDDVAIGTKLIINDGDGKVIPTASTPEMEPFRALEAYTDPTADKLILCRYTGH